MRSDDDWRARNDSLETRIRACTIQLRPGQTFLALICHPRIYR
jgi:hypothetical protein